MAAESYQAVRMTSLLEEERLFYNEYLVEAYSELKIFSCFPSSLVPEFMVL
jgi:hypothetical protein